jgi:methyl-accepting chemotaxis protein
VAKQRGCAQCIGSNGGDREFWTKLNRGEYQATEYKRIGKGGKEAWIQASYNPILDSNGKPFKVIKFATDITAKTPKHGGCRKDRCHPEGAGRHRVQHGRHDHYANENFLKTMGYSLAEIQGRHHSRFVEPAMRDSAEYREFWAKLNRGEYSAAEYKRVGKGGKEIWILASYNPILDEWKNPLQASEVRDRRHRPEIEYRRLRRPNRRDREIASRYRLQHGRHDPYRQHNFLSALGYSLAEIQRKHHGLFVEASERDSAGYRAFWDNLNRRKYQAGEYKQIGKGGREIRSSI